MRTALHNTNTADCEYNEYDIKQTNQVIHGIDNEGMIIEI